VSERKERKPKMAKIITNITKCEECPHIRYNDGAGFGEPFWTCNETGKLVFDGDDSSIPNYLDSIPPWCPLEDEDELIRKFQPTG